MGLSNTIKVIQRASIENLLDRIWLSHTIASVGLYNDGRPLYGQEWAVYQNPIYSSGLWQHPLEYADYLIWVVNNDIHHIIDIGCFFGYGTIITSEYIKRFNSSSICTGLDNRQRIFDFDFDFRLGTSEDIKSESYDLAFVDADHSYTGAKTDYDNLKHNCKYIAFHDIRDRYVRDAPGYDGGVPKLYSELIKNHPHIEFIREDGMEIFGIGVISQ